MSNVAPDSKLEVALATSPDQAIASTNSLPTKHNIAKMATSDPFNVADMASSLPNVSVAIDPVALITTECITVTSAMRKHARWAHSSVSAILGGSSSPATHGLPGPRPLTSRDELGPRKGQRSRASLADAGDDVGLANRWGLRGKKGKSMQDNPLMAGFGRLRRELNGCKGNATLLSNVSDAY